MSTERWEDVIPVWTDPGYGDREIPFSATAARRQLAGAIISLAEPVDWYGKGGKDILLSAWDACYGASVRLYAHTGTGTDGTPELAFDHVLEGVSGFVTVVPDGDTFHLLSTSRLRRSLHLHVNIGTVGNPRFADPLVLDLDADWQHDGEIFHLARFHDIQGDDRPALVLGTDYWTDYWPDGKEWNVEGYRPYGTEGRWRGGPLRGHLYVFANHGTRREPRLGRGVAVTADDGPIEVYGQLGPAFGDFRGNGRDDLICGSFLDRLYFHARRPDGTFAAGRMALGDDGQPLVLDHCIHLPAAVDWDGDGRTDLLVGAEDGRIWFIRNSGQQIDGTPVFERPVPIMATDARPHVGVLPMPAAADWSGNGREDLIVGNSTGELLYVPVDGGPEAPRLGTPRPVQAGGHTVRVAAGPSGSLQGPSEFKFGYTSPAAGRWFGGERPDLVMSDIFGRYLAFRNLGGEPPQFEAPRELQFEGRPLRTVWRVRPAITDWAATHATQLVTLDADGILCAFEQLSDTVVGNKTPLLDADDRPIRFTEDFGGGRGRIKLTVCDWTGDGHLDIVYGTHNRASVPPDKSGIPRHTTYQAGVFLLKNIGDNDRPRFAPAKPFLYQEQPLVLGMHECAATPVWWRKQPLPDLVIGVEDGTLLWLKRDSLAV
jgi:hypothetical protein